MMQGLQNGENVSVCLFKLLVARGQCKLKLSVLSTLVQTQLHMCIIFLLMGIFTQNEKCNSKQNFSIRYIRTSLLQNFVHWESENQKIYLFSYSFYIPEGALVYFFISITSQLTMHMSRQHCGLDMLNLPESGLAGKPRLYLLFGFPFTRSRLYFFISARFPEEIRC